MGFDISGLNPQLNNDMSKYPILKKWEGNWKDRNEDNKEWIKDRDAYHTECDLFQSDNPGDYFRNNVWWWRPLWTYCERVCGDLLTQEEWEHGSWNDGHEYDADICKEMARLLQETIDNGECKKYQDDYKEWQNSLEPEICARCNGNNRGHNKKKECNVCDNTGVKENWNASYPFDVENVQNFVNFLRECGGMSIC